MINYFLDLSKSFLTHNPYRIGSLDIILTMQDRSHKTTPDNKIDHILSIYSEPVYKGFMDISIIVQISTVL